jgi:basic membrane protein A
MNRSKTPTPAVAGLLSAAALLVAGCGLFSNPPGQTPTPTPSSDSPSAGTSISTETATPGPTRQLVKSITLVASIGEPKNWTPAGLTWNGIESAAARIGATTTLVQPVSNAELADDIDQAAAAEAGIVVTVGPASDAAVRAAATGHPLTQFFEVDVVVSNGAPANVHGLVFDEAEAGYLAGYVAASFSSSGSIGMVGDVQDEVQTTNYAAGFGSGAAQEKPGFTVVFAYAGTSDSPEKGRAAATGLVKAGSDVIVALPSLSGIGAFREACTAKARLVAVDTDAWQTVPDVQTCLIVSVMKRYDVAVSVAIAAATAGRAVSRESVNDVANGGIAMSDFHANLPAGFGARLDAVVVTLKAGPPRTTSAPPTSRSSAGESAAP